MVTNGSRHHKCLDCEKLVYYGSLRCNKCASKISKFLRFKKSFNPIIINSDTEQVLLGSVLGDGSLCLNTKYSNSNAYFSEAHSLKQKDYLLWKDEYLKCFNTIIEYGSKTLKSNQKVYSQVRLRSKSNATLTKYYKDFYFKHIKLVTQKILNKLKPLGLAVWYMDD